MIRSILTLLITALLSACLLPGDRAARVTGMIVDEKQQIYSHCSIDLLAEIGKDLHRLRHMKRQLVLNGANFEHLFILSAGRQRYSVEISCTGTNDIYLSEPLVLDRPLDNPLNLGQIILTRTQ